MAGLTVSLLTIGYMSVDRVQKLLKNLRIPVSSGAIQDMLTKAARLAKAPVERIRQTAERAIRCARGKEKVSGCFRAKSGADHFACVVSFFSTALYGVSSFDASVATFRGNAVGVFQGKG